MERLSAGEQETQATGQVSSRTTTRGSIAHCDIGGNGKDPCGEQWGAIQLRAPPAFRAGHRLAAQRTQNAPTQRDGSRSEAKLDAAKRERLVTTETLSDEGDGLEWWLGYFVHRRFKPGILHSTGVISCICSVCCTAVVFVFNRSILNFCVRACAEPEHRAERCVLLQRSQRPSISVASRSHPRRTQDGTEQSRAAIATAAAAEAGIG